jgi:hypothetical protein
MYLAWPRDSAGRAFTRKIILFMAFGRLGALARVTFLAKFLLRFVSSLDGLAYGKNVVVRRAFTRKRIFFVAFGRLGALSRSTFPVKFLLRFAGSFVGTLELS